MKNDKIAILGVMATTEQTPSSSSPGGAQEGPPPTLTSSLPRTSSGYTILVPANVRYRGAELQLDLKLDQKTLVEAEKLSRAHDAVSRPGTSGSRSSGSDILEQQRIELDDQGEPINFDLLGSESHP